MSHAPPPIPKGFMPLARGGASIQPALAANRSQPPRPATVQHAPAGAGRAGVQVAQARPGQHPAAFGRPPPAAGGGHAPPAVAQMRQLPGTLPARAGLRAGPAHGAHRGAPAAGLAAPARPGGPPAHRPGPPAVAQAMLAYSGSYGGGFGGFGGFGGDDGDDGDDPRKWKPWEPTDKPFLFPRNKKAGGKHFIPAGWIDRLFSVAYTQAGTLGRALEFIEDIRELLGEDAPLEISFYRMQEDESSAYRTLTNSRQIGYDQIVHTYRERLREWAQNIYSSKIDSTGDSSGKQIDMPDNPSKKVSGRLRAATLALVALFDKWIGRYGPTVQFPFKGTVYVQDKTTGFSVPKEVSGNKVEISWLVIRAKIMEMLGNL